MRIFFIFNLVLALAAPNLPAADVESLRLVPFPKTVRFQAGNFNLEQASRWQVSRAQNEAFTGILNQALAEAGVSPIQGDNLETNTQVFRLGPSAPTTTWPVAPKEGAPEGYALEIRADEIVCSANGPAGLFYGLQTLCQLIRANRDGNHLPALSISDWPSLRWRCFQDDMTRGPSSTLNTLKYEAALGAALKLNLMTFYMEYQYAFKKHPKIGPPEGSLTPEELSALIQYLKPLHLDLLGNQQSFGHFRQILRHPEYAPLRESPDVLTPVREETYRLLDDLYSEVCPLLPFPWFNVCCDETFDLGTGPSKELAAQIGVGGVYVRHIRRVHDLLKDKYQKRMMMWGDIILQHPEQLAAVPKDTIMLTWGYDPRANFESQIIPFAKSGYEFFVCPGVNNWSRILPDFGAAATNIQHFVRDGIKHGALGMLNTDWEDDGEAINAVKWHADAWAAECAWNGSRTPLEAFNRRLGAVLFAEQGNHFGQAIAALAQTHRLPGMNQMLNPRFWENDFSPKTSPVRIERTASNLLAVVRPALMHLEACRREARANHPILDAITFGARRMELIGQRMLDGLAAARLYESAFASMGAQSDDAARLQRLTEIERLIRKNRDATENLGRQFAALWLSESKPYALDWTLRRYTNAVGQYDQLLKQLAAIRGGGAWPEPEKIGLAIPNPLARRLKLRAVQPMPLAAAAPWADASASHRLGLRVQAGGFDRFDLPVEVELSLPKELASKPARAFRLAASGTPQEVPVQVDASEQDGKCRLVLVLPGLLPKGAETSVQVYLGLSQPPSSLPTAVQTRAEGQNTFWLENDRVRLWLGSEGAHVYRWEVKSAENRDLTMPGETDWAGFSDIGTHRHTPYRLNCTARGPAMVEYQCSDPAGHVKIVRLYSGVSWMEVLLNETTPAYWDFDHPKNFAADGPTPGKWLFSNGQTGPVGREADGVPAQVQAGGVFWGVKFNEQGLALGLLTPETAARHLTAPGSGAGGVGIESSPPASHFITFAGRLEHTPAETMNRLLNTLNLKHPVEVSLHPLQSKP